MSENHNSLSEKLYLLEKSEENISKIDETLKNIILDFLFAFNVFESEFFEEPKYENSNNGKRNPKGKSVRQRRKAMQRFCNKNSYFSNSELLKKLSRFQLHFKKIYFDENDKGTIRYNSLLKSENNITGCYSNDHEDIRKFLTNPLENNKKYAVMDALLISYVFRNNLFHGEKNLLYLNDYKEDFRVITKFLIALMKFFRDMDADVF